MNEEGTTNQTEIPSDQVTEQPAKDGSEQTTTDPGQTNEQAPSEQQGTGEGTDTPVAEQPPVDDPEQQQTQFVTLFETPKGEISVVHDITLGNLLIATILMAMLIFQVLDRFIRR